MEGLVAVGLASNVLQFVDFAKSIISDAKIFYETSSGAKDEYHEAEDYAHRLQRLAAQIVMPQAPHCGDMSGEEKELKELGEWCSQIANELLAATRDVTATSHNDWVQSAKKAVKARLSSSQIKSLQTRLDRISQQLTGKLIHNQLKRTENTLSWMSDENRRLSSRRDGDIRHLQEQLHYVTMLLEKGGSQRDAVMSLSGIAKTGAQFSAEQHILERLFFHGMNDRHRNVHVEHEETLRWVFEDNSPVNFVEFLESQNNLYWVSGKPGSGKSTAMKYICQHSETKRRLEQWATGNELIVASFFFWNAGTSYLPKSQEGLLQSILYQILHAAPALIPHAFPEDWDAYLSGSLITSSPKGSQFSTTQLLAAIQLLCPHLPELHIKICIFVDGLDEYDGRPGDVIKLIETLKASDNFKACVSSRPWNEFENAFGQDKTNKLYMQDLTRSDIRKYVRDTLENNKTFRELVESEGEASSMDLVHDLVDAAQGVFLWVILVVRSLLDGLTNADTFNNLQRRLQSLPTDLDEYFDRILFSVDEFYSQQASEICLVTLTAASRLPLMSYWFMDQKSSEYALNLEIQPMPPQLINPRLKAMRRRLNACCKGLLETVYDGPLSQDNLSNSDKILAQKVDFLHRTVRDFLRTPQTQHRLLDRVSKGFNAEVAISRALLAQIKSLSHEKDVFLSNRFFADFLDDLFIQAAALENDRIPVHTEVELMDELGSTLEVQAKLADVDIFRLSTLRITTDFLSWCLELNMLRYIYELLGRRQRLPREELSCLLATANQGVGARSWGEPQDKYLWSKSQLQLTRRLFKVGADPNCTLAPLGTPWTVFLDSIARAGMERIRKKHEAIVFSILEEYTKHGATLQSIKEGAFGGSPDYKKMLKDRMTEEQFDKLLKLADSKGIKDRLARGLRQIPGFWKVLKKIARHG